MRLTDNENTVLAGFNASPSAYSFWDGGIVPGEDSGTWSLIFVEEMAKVLDKPTKSARGVFASLIKKELFVTHHQEADEDSPAQEWVQLTEAGVDAIADLRFDTEAEDFEVELEEEAPLPPMIAKAAKERKAKSAKKPAANASTTTRFSHANCNHETSGREGKIARAKCRKEHALLEHAAELVTKA